MESKWEFVKAIEYCSSVRDGTHGTPKKQPDGKKLITSKNIVGNRLDQTTAYYISEDDYCEINKRSKVDQGDVLLSMIGTVGASCLILNEPDFAIKNVGLFKTRSILDGKWLFYYLKSRLGQQQVESRLSGSTQKFISLSSLRELPVIIPPSDAEKQKVTQILGTLDDKIELNRKMNKTLEAMAQALFQSWFVDFDPVIDKALANGKEIPEELSHRVEVRKKAREEFPELFNKYSDLFPDSFHYTEELGWIPEGWVSGRLGNIAKARGGYAFKSNCFLDKGYTVVKIKNLVGDGTVSLENSQCISEETANTVNRFILKDGDIVMAMTGATVGKSGVIVTNGRPVYLNQRVAKFESASEQRIEPFVFCYFRETKHYDYIVGTSGGSAQPNISSTQIESAPCTIPHLSVIRYFTNEADIWLKKWIQNMESNRLITKLRDTLLPKLISGEIDVSKFETTVSEHL